MSINKIVVIVFCLWLLPVVAWAAPATLTVTPGPNVAPNDVLKFSVLVPYQDPAPIVSVQQGGTMWSSELVSVKFASPGAPATVNFAKTFPIPDDAKNGTSFCFIVVNGGGNVEMKQPISNKACVTVKIVLRANRNEPVVKPVSVIPGVMNVFKPDLTIGEVKWSNNIYSCQVHVLNQGGNAAAACLMTIESGNKLLKTVAVPALAKGASAWIDVTVAQPLGPNCNCTIRFKADSADTVKEANETNNVKFFDYTIK